MPLKLLLACIMVHIRPSENATKPENHQTAKWFIFLSSFYFSLLPAFFP